MTTVTELHVRRDVLGTIAAARREVETGDGQALFRVEHFALTANNMTYAVHGEDMRYWDFFPVASEIAAGVNPGAGAGVGVVPVWGFGQVAESRVAGLEVGQRFYGYWPMASHALLSPGRISPRGFVDVAAHRQHLATVYNGYVAASSDFGSEALQALFRPLYMTAFVLDQMLMASPVRTLVLTSASSKTALGLAQAARGRQRVIGLTGSNNREFVEATGYYDMVLEYGSAAALAGETGPAALVDFSGDGAVRQTVHASLGDRLLESHVVGDTHWNVANNLPLPGVAPKLFFAPTVIAERIAEWGQPGFEERLARAWRGFIASTTWLKIIDGRGAATVAAHWRDVAAGQINPSRGLYLGI